MKPRTWILEILIAIDRLGNALSRGSADETISSRAHRAAMEGRPAMAAFIDTIFGVGHCERAWAWESRRWRPEVTADEAGAPIAADMKEPA